MPTEKEQIIMLGHKMFKTSLPEYQTINICVNKQLFFKQ